jgi:uncharacterized protein Smg (DUF494 family)
MKTYTEEEVDKLVRATLTETVQGFLEWLKAETNIVDKDTKEVLPNTEIDLKPERKGIMQKYIYPRLVKHGIIFTDENGA